MEYNEVTVYSVSGILTMDEYFWCLGRLVLATRFMLTP